MRPWFPLLAYARRRWAGPWQLHDPAFASLVALTAAGSTTRSNLLQLAPTRSNFKREVGLKAVTSCCPPQPPAQLCGGIEWETVSKHSLLFAERFEAGRPVSRCQRLFCFLPCVPVSGRQKSRTHHASQRRVPHAQRARLTGDAPDTSSEQPLRRGRSWWPPVSVGAVVYR